MFGEGCYLHTAIVLTYSTDKLRKWMFICIGWCKYPMMHNSGKYPVLDHVLYLFHKMTLNISVYIKVIVTQYTTHFTYIN